MEVPPLIKRRYVDIEKYLDGLLLNYKKYPKVDIKEKFIHNVCQNLSLWFVREYSYYEDNHDMGEQVNEFRKYFIYAFRTKISIFWEQW
jgi:hypothetical protein